MNHAPTHSMQPLVDTLVASLVAARHSVRVRLHLLSSEAREHWQELEAELDCLQSRLEYEGARIKPSAVGRVRELTETVREFLREHRAIDLVSPRPSIRNA